MNRRVEPLGQHDRPCGHPEREHQTVHEEQQAVRSRRLLRRDRRVEDPELGSLLLFHSLPELGILVALQEGEVELPGGLVIPRQRLKLLLPLGSALDPSLIGGDVASHLLVLGLDPLELRVHLAQLLLQAKLRRVGRSLPFPHRSAVRIRLGQRALEGGDLRLHANDLWILVGEALAQLDQLHLEPRQPSRGAVGNVRRAHVAQLLHQRHPSLRCPEVPVAVQAHLIIQPHQDGEVRGDLLRELIAGALLEFPHPALLLVQLGLGRLELRPEELGRRRRLVLTDAQVLLDVEGRQRVGDLGHDLGVRATVAERERDRRAPHTGLADLPGLELDIPSHSLDGRLRRHPSQIAVEVEAGDQLFQARTAQGLLADGVKPGLELVGPEGSNRGLGQSDEGLRHFLRLHDECRGRPVDVGHRFCDGEGGREQSDEDQNRQPLPPAPHVAGQIESRARGHPIVYWPSSGPPPRQLHRGDIAVLKGSVVVLHGGRRPTGPRRCRRAGGRS